MHFVFTIVFYYAAVWATCNCVEEFDLKIEHNESLDKQTSQDKLNIAFVNKINSNETATVNNEISDFKSRVIANSRPEQLGKDESDIKNLADNLEMFKIHRIDAVNRAMITQSKDMKQRLNRFRMSRMNSFYVTPAFEYKYNGHGTRHFYSTHEWRRLPSQFVGKQDFYKTYPTVNRPVTEGRIKNERFYRNDIDAFEDNYDDITYQNSPPNHKIHNTNNRFENVYMKRKKTDLTQKNGNTEFQNTYNGREKDINVFTWFNDPKLEEVLRKQSQLIEKLEGEIKRVRPLNIGAEFYDLLASMENRINVSTTVDSKQERITSKAETTTLPPTVIAMVDETEVRQALKKDPFVQRILKMANQKKKEYMKQ